MSAQAGVLETTHFMMSEGWSEEEIYDKNKWEKFEKSSSKLF